MIRDAGTFANLMIFVVTMALVFGMIGLAWQGREIPCDLQKLLIGCMAYLIPNQGVRKREETAE